jgi:dTDP-glucose 4,6-dehydratase
MRILITGGAGFLGSHLCDSLIRRGDTVLCLDDLSTGSLSNITHHLDSPRFDFIEADISAPLAATWDAPEIDAVIHMASSASPPDYLRRPLETLSAGSRGTENALRIALQHNARFVLASTSEVYGDPHVHPQPEDYWGNVNPLGPRSVYDEAKRYAEALTAAYARTMGINAGIIRIFNTYGPRMRPSDGRVVSNFVWQALHGEPLTVYGDGSQTRSLCYVDDLIRGITAMIDCGEFGPVNLGNPEELSVSEFARLVLAVTGSDSPIEYRPLPQDDPVRRRPQITQAEKLLGWKPQISVLDGIQRTAEWFSSAVEMASR